MAIRPPNLNAGKAGTFASKMDLLWTDYIVYMRFMMIEIMSGQGALDVTKERILQTTRDIAGAISDFYDNETTWARLADLMSDRVYTAEAIMNGLKAGHDSGILGFRTSWTENGRAFAEELAAINPALWSVADGRKHMDLHLNETYDGISHYVRGEYQESIDSFDRLHLSVLQLSRWLAVGVLTKFEDRFRTRIA